MRPASTASATSTGARGPKTPRHYQFVARGIAEALNALGAGRAIGAPRC